jgi:hypothetical protein
MRIGSRNYGAGILSRKADNRWKATESGSFVAAAHEAERKMPRDLIVGGDKKKRILV